MTDHALALSFLADRLADATGCDRDHALEDAKALFAVMRAMGLITPAALALWERDARILTFRGQGLSCTLIAFRLGMARSKVFEAIGRHQGARRAALRNAG